MRIVAMRFRTALSLGLRNVVRVVWYRLLKKAGYYRFRLPQGSARSGVFFVSDCTEFGSIPDDESTLSEAQSLKSGLMRLFGGEQRDVGSPPHWHKNHYTGRICPGVGRYWSSIDEFSAQGDIKAIWEMSRFGWALLLTRAYLCSGDHRYLDSLNAWASDWQIANPANTGPNWMCGQEASIRMTHVIFADALLRKTGQPLATLEAFVVVHCERIAATVGYALGQSNNHATSEAMGLFVGGAWLAANATRSRFRRRGANWRTLGQDALQKLVQHLVLPDGTFSQYSINYQRVLVDTLSIVEWWRQRANLPEFSADFYKRARCAANWLFSFTDSASGRCPNMGANDGSRLLPLDESSINDYRPSLQLAGVLFNGHKYFSGDGEFNKPLRWLDVDSMRADHSERANCVYRNGGFVVMYDPLGQSAIFGRFPVFRFRPGQADVLHIDLWSGATNILRDAGSYSYSETDAPWNQSYFSGVQAHNTCQFDDHDQMPRISRFLFGGWLSSTQQTFSRDAEHPHWSVAYQDRWGCSHRRSVTWRDDRWVVTDRVSGFHKRAVLRWRLNPDVSWYIEGNELVSKILHIRVTCDSEIARFELADGQESSHYLQRTPLPVLEVEVLPGTEGVTTELLVR